MQISRLFRDKKQGRRWVVLTAYDAPSARIAAAAGADWLLVGDSLAMVVLGRESTVETTMDEMIHHAKAVRLGAPKLPVIGDLPYEAVSRGPGKALAAARRFITEGGTSSVKLEWAADAPKIASELKKAKIPFMGHVGLTPQTAAKSGGFRVRGRDAEEAAKVFDAAHEFQKRGAYAVVLECVPGSVAAQITQALTIPTIGIGAGVHCDGQVLVFHDVMGLYDSFQPRFAKRYADAGKAMRRGAERFAREVRTGRFPQARHTYKMPIEEWRAFMQLKTETGK